MVKWGSTDANEKGIVRALSKIPGITVVKLSQVGGGVPDIMVGYKDFNYLFEIKDPDKPKSSRKLTPAQVIFHDSWRGQADVVETLDEIIELVGRD